MALKLKTQTQAFLVVNNVLVGRIYIEGCSTTLLLMCTLKEGKCGLRSNLKVSEAVL